MLGFAFRTVVYGVWIAVFGSMLLSPIMAEPEEPDFFLQVLLGWPSGEMRREPNFNGVWSPEGFCSNSNGTVLIGAPTKTLPSGIDRWPVLRREISDLAVRRGLKVDPLLYAPWVDRPRMRIYLEAIDGDTIRIIGVKKFATRYSTWAKRSEIQELVGRGSITPMPDLVLKRCASSK